MASYMGAKFDKYWNVIHGIMAIATVLDPRFKMKLLEFYFPKMYQNDSSYEIDKIRMICYELVTKYQLKNNTREEVYQSTIASSSQLELVLGKVDPLASFDLFVSSTTSDEHVKSELDHYLGEPVLPRSPNFDILAW